MSNDRINEGLRERLKSSPGREMTARFVAHSDARAAKRARQKVDRAAAELATAQRDLHRLGGLANKSEMSASASASASASIRAAAAAKKTETAQAWGSSLRTPSSSESPTDFAAALKSAFASKRNEAPEPPEAA